MGYSTRARSACLHGFHRSGFLVALPSFGIDMSRPALTATGAALGVAPAQAGLTMSLFMFGFAVAPLFYGPASDRYGRKPVVVFACTLFIIAGIGCAFARSLPTLLIWRVARVRVPARA
jgi:MFS transporter, DHA1 family, multidrug resistance protein